MIIIITAGLLTGLLRWHAYEDVQKDEIEKLSFQIKLAEKEVSGLIRRINIVLEEMALALDSNDVASAVNQGQHYKKLLPEISAFTIVDHAGIIRGASIKTLVGADRLEAAHYKEASKNPDRSMMFIGRPFKDSSGASIMLFNRVVADHNGKLKWIAIASVNIKSYDRILRALINSDTQSIFLVHGDGQILSHNAEYEGLRLQPVSEYVHIAQDHLSSVVRQNAHHNFINAENLKVYAVTSDVIPQDLPISRRLLVGITDDSRLLLSQWNSDTLIYFFVWLLTSLLMLYLLYLHFIRENSLLHSESRFKDFTDTASDWIWEMDAGLRFTYISELFFKIANFVPSDLIGKTRWEYTTAATAGVDEKTWQAHREAMESHQSFRDFRYKVTDADGIEYHISLSGKPVFVNSRFSGYRGTGTNITQLVNALNEAREAQLKAEAASKFKSQFLSSMSHELRTPMNAVLGYAQLLDMGLKEKEHKEYVQVMLESGRHLMELINDVLDLSTIEAGQMQYALESIELTTLLDECRSLCLPLALERNTIINIEPLAAAYYVYADRVRLRQALLNYLSNAIKYGKQQAGLIRVVTTQYQDKLRIAVVDNGDGIAAEKIHQLFSPFNRLGLEGGSQLGAGLGLSITKKIVEGMQGEVGVESDAQGASFWLELPQCKPDTERQRLDESAITDTSVASREKNKAIKVLYVEDNKVNAKLVSDLVKRMRPEIELSIAETGEQGIEQAVRHKKDILIIDIQLPDMNGLELLKTLRSLEINTPAFALTAAAVYDDIERGKAAGFDEYLTKPLDAAMLFSSIDKYINK